jgi:DHA2 family multidrug resistance protein
MVATTMTALDTTIANVALPHIQGSIAATQEQMSWVITSYIVAAAIMTPLSAWISNRFGRKRFLLISIAAFTVTSVLCGMAQSLSQIVIFRLLQGLSGAALVPMSQAILLDINPPERHARAMAMWVMGVTIGPIFGAPLGAWITDYLGWRWVFFINVPTGLFCLIGLSAALTESAPSKRPLDFFGFATLSIATLCFQLLLDRGQIKDWFTSPEIWAEATCAALAAYLFVVHSATTREPFINLRLFEDRNYATASVLGIVTGVLLLGPLVLMTSLLQGLMQYPVLTAGYITVSRAIGSVASSAVMGRLQRYFDSRFIISLGFVLTAVALAQMCRFNLQMPQSLVFWSGMLYGFGNGMVTLAISTIAFTTLPPPLRPEGAAVSNLIRNIGGSIGIALIQTLFIRNSFVMHTRLAEHVTRYGTTLHDPTDLSSTIGLAAMDGRVAQQAAMMAYVNMFKLLLVIAILCIPLSLLFRKAANARVGVNPPALVE